MNKVCFVFISTKAPNQLGGPVKEWGYPIGKGGFGQVTTGYTYGRGVYAVKRFVLDTELDNETIFNEDVLCEYHQTLYEAMKEICMIKLGSVFEFGPMCPDAMGFDMITYSNAIDICMEKCFKSTDQNRKKNK